MADELLSTGLTIDDEETRLASIVGELRTSVSALLDVSEDQPTGQIVRILTDHEQQLAELLQELHSAIDPNQATGQSLDAICSVTGTYRRAATYGTVTCACTFTGAGVTLPLGTMASVTGDPDNLWEVTTAYTSTGAGPENVGFTATEPGAIPALINTITVIATPVAGWLTVINSAAAAATGLARETDTELRLRREIEVTVGGSTSVDSLAAEVSQITGVLEVSCYENDSWRPVAPMPPKSTEVVFWSTYAGAALTALEALIAAAIFDTKAGGPSAYGTTYVTHVDDHGNSHQIGMTLATAQRLQLNYVLVTNADYPGNATFIAAVVAAANALHGIADDVFRAKMYDIAFDVAGVVNITTMQLRWFGGAWGIVDLNVAEREIATLDAADVFVAP